MKLLMRVLAVAFTIILLSLLLSRVTTAKAPTIEYDETNQYLINHPQIVAPSKSSNPSSTKTPSPIGSYTGRHYSKEEVVQLIKDYANQYRIPADLPLRVANCESGYNQFSKNKSSTASGVFQYIASTWRNTAAGKLGVSPFDADANVHMAIKSIASGGIGNWAASKSCWNK